MKIISCLAIVEVGPMNNTYKVYYTDGSTLTVVATNADEARYMASQHSPQPIRCIEYIG